VISLTASSKPSMADPATKKGRSMRPSSIERRYAAN
jgi:hypothetical protein